MTNQNDQRTGVGATSELSLRVSVASLVRLLFSNPGDHQTMLVLERVATLREVEGRPEVKVSAKPFGGGVRIMNSEELWVRLGQFNFDSERSRRENDFRIQVRPQAWEAVKAVCREHVQANNGGILDSSPERELVEEFEDSLKSRLKRNHYDLRPSGIAIEDRPVETMSVRAAGRPTVRLYFVFEVWLRDADVIARIMANDSAYSDADLERMAWSDAQRGGKGRANAVLVAGLDEVRDAYRSLSTEMRGESMRLGEHRLEGNVLAVLEDVEQTRFQRDAV